MFAAIAGTLGLIGLMWVSQRRLFAHLGGHHCHGGHGGHGFHGGWGRPGPGFRGFRGRGPRGRLRALLMELDTTPGQEKAIGRALETLWERLTDARKELDDARKELAASLADAELDRRTLDAALSHYRQLFERASADVAEMLTSVHEVLDEKQRKRLAELIAESPLGPGWTREY